MSDLDLACDAAVGILSTKGAAALSVRAIAQAMNLTGPALTHRWDSKARLFGLLVSRIGDRWLDVLSAAVDARGPVGILPGSEEDVDDARTWLVLAGIGRSDTDLSARVALVVQCERAMLRTALERVHGARLPEVVVDATYAVASGLRERVCVLGEPMSVADAGQVWALAIERLVPAATRPQRGPRAGRGADA